MREIKFRGKRVDNGELVYGYLFEYATIMNEPKAEILVVCDEHGTMRRFEVIPESVGQFTGLPDREKNEIFGNDIIDGSYTNPMTGELVKRFYLVVFENGCYIAKPISKSPYGDTQLYFVNEKCKVVGNSFDNSSLLEVQP